MMPIASHARGGKWGPALDAVIKGKTIYIPEHRPEVVVGSLKRDWITKQGFRIRSHVHKNGGTVAWLEKR